MRWVRQEHANGCALATAAMLTGRTYGEMRDRADGYFDEPRDWQAHGVSHYELDRLLAEHGGFVQRHYVAYREKPWPREPWAPLHYAMVVQPSGNTHFVAMEADGRVLDPLREGVYALADWPKVNQVVGVIFQGPLR